MSMTPLRPPARSALESVSRALRVFVRSRVGRVALLGVAAVGTYGLWNWVTTESVEEQRAGDLSSPLKIETVKSFIVRKDGQKHWEVVADSAQVVDSGEAWLARGVSRGVLFRDDAPWITMRAPRVRYSNGSKNLDAVGGVTAQGPENFSFSTQQARWLEAKKLVEIPGAARARLRDMQFAAPSLSYQWELGTLQSPGPVEVRVKGGILRGQQMSANINTRVVKLGSQVELQFTPGVAKMPQPFASPSPNAASANAASANAASANAASANAASANAASANAASAVRPADFRSDASDSAFISASATEMRPPIMSRSRIVPTALVLAAAAPAALLVQAPGAPPAQAAPPAKAAGDVLIDGGNLTYSDNNGVSVLSGGVTLREVGKKFALTAGNVTYDSRKNQANARGNLKIETPSSTIRGGELFGDFNRKLLSISGNVVISAYDKGNGMSSFRSSAARKPVRIACNRLDWNYITQQATLVGNLRIVQADNSGTCNSIVYDEPRNIVTLRGNVRFGNSKNQQFAGDLVTIYVDKGVVVAPNVRLRSSPDLPSSPSRAPAVKAPPPIKFPAPNAPTVGSGSVDLPKAPPPIESLIPKSKPMVRPKPTLPPLPTPTAQAKAPETEAGEE